MANRIRIDTRLLNVNWTTGTTYRLELGSGLVREVGNNRSFSAAQSNAKTFTTFDTGPTIASVTPAVGATNSFATTAAITFNRTIYENPTPSNFFLYKDVVGGADELVATFTTTSSRVTRVGNTINIDLKNLVDSSSTYYLQSSDPLYRDMFNFPNEQLSQAKFSYTTGRPNIDDVTPDFGTTGSFATTAVISYDRDVKKRSGNFYLYKEGIVDELIETFTTASSKVSIDGDDVSIDLRYLLNGESTYYITSDYGAVDDLITNFRAEPVTEEKFKYSTGPGPKPIAVSPAYASTGSFISTATITFDKPITLYSNTVYLYKNDTVYRTLPVGSTNLRVINGNTLEITVYDQPIPEDIYYIGFDLGVVIDSNTFSAEPVDDDSLVKWTSKSITDIANDEYDSRTTTPIFENNWFNVLDRSPNANEQYTLTLIATSGTFTASGGISVGNTWIYTGTNQQISNIGGVNFIANVKDMNWDLPIQTTLAKQNTILAVRNNTIIGIPYNLDSMPLISNTYTNSVGSSTVLTVTANTNSNISTPVTFRTSSTVLGTSTFINNTASFTLQPNAIATGTYEIFAQWAGQTYAPKFNGRNSDSISQTLVPKANTQINLSISTSSYIIRPEVGTTLNPNPILSVQLPAVYPTHSSIGSITLRDGATTIANGELSVSNTQSTTTLTWNPESFNQVDTGARTITASYQGDFWNNSATNSIAFQATLKNTATMTLSANSLTIVRPDNFILTTTASKNTMNGRTLEYFSGTTKISTTTFVQNTSSITLSSMDFPVAGTQFKSSFAGDFNFYAFDSNTLTVNVVKRDPSFGYAPTSLNTLRRPYLSRQRLSYLYNNQSIDRTGKTLSFFLNGAFSYNTTVSGTFTDITLDPKQLTPVGGEIGSITYQMRLLGDDVYNTATSLLQQIQVLKTEPYYTITPSLNGTETSTTFTVNATDGILGQENFIPDGPARSSGTATIRVTGVRDPWPVAPADNTSAGLRDFSWPFTQSSGLVNVANTTGVRYISTSSTTGVVIPVSINETVRSAINGCALNDTVNGDKLYIYRNNDEVNVYHYFNFIGGLNKSNIYWKLIKNTTGPDWLQAFYDEGTSSFAISYNQLNSIQVSYYEYNPFPYQQSTAWNVTQTTERIYPNQAIAEILNGVDRPFPYDGIGSNIAWFNVAGSPTGAYVAYGPSSSVQRDFYGVQPYVDDLTADLYYSGSYNKTDVISLRTKPARSNVWNTNTVITTGFLSTASSSTVFGPVNVPTGYYTISVTVEEDSNFYINTGTGFVAKGL